MATQVEICNLALTILGADTITAITEQVKNARTLNALWNTTRDKELRAHRWKFSITRTTLPALATVPASGPYTQQFQLPSGCLRVLEVGNGFPGFDLSDFRSGPTTDDYAVEEGLIRTNLPAPLALRYAKQVTDPTQWDSCFAEAFAAKLAWWACYRITNSNEMKKQAAVDYMKSISEAIRANALESQPQFDADDTWVASRMGGAGSPATANW